MRQDWTNKTKSRKTFSWFCWCTCHGCGYLWHGSDHPWHGCCHGWWVWTFGHGYLCSQMRMYPGTQSWRSLASTNQAKGFEPLPPVVPHVTRNPRNTRACPQWHRTLILRPEHKSTNQSNSSTSAVLAFFALCEYSVTLNAINQGIFSRSKLQTAPEARASSWRLAHNYNGGLKLVHYDYTVLCIYFTFYKLAALFLVLFRLPSSFACVLRWYTVYAFTPRFCDFIIILLHIYLTLVILRGLWLRLWADS